MTRQVNASLALVDGWLIDCVLSESHSFEAEVSEYPVESGADITDAVRSKPVVVEMDCVISDTPLPPISSLRGPRDDGTAFSLLSATQTIASLSGKLTPSQEAFQRLVAIRDAREPVTIRTSLKTYTSMALTGLTIPRSKDTGGQLRFTATWQQVEIVQNDRAKRVAIPAARGGGKKKNLPPTPTKAGDSLYRVAKVRRAFGLGGDWIWFDQAIDGWRYGALPLNSIAANRALGPGANPGAIPQLLSPKPDDNRGFALYKGKVYGASDAEWHAHQNDVYWSQVIAAEPHDGPLGSRFDPFASLDNVADIGLVTGIQQDVVR